MASPNLFEKRIALVQAFLQDKGYDGILISRTDNFAMATGGKRNYVNMFSDAGACSLFVTRDGEVDFIGNTIESPRVMEEELADCRTGVREFLWFEGNAASQISSELDGNVVSDDGAVGKSVHGELAYLRALLTEEELEKYRRIGQLASESMMAVLNAIELGVPEAEIAARLIAEGEQRRCHVPVVLVAADERIRKYRHPLPTAAPVLENGNQNEVDVNQYAMVVGCFVREGLVVSITRFKQVGDLPYEVDGAYARISAVDAVIQEATEPGATLGQVFEACQTAYAELGFAPDEWHNHHQGGATGYAGRTCKGRPGETFPVLDTTLVKRAGEILDHPFDAGQAFAWNPSAPGVKSEDTFIVLPDGTKEIVTRTPYLPDVDLAAVLGRPTPVVKSAMAR